MANQLKVEIIADEQRASENVAKFDRQVTQTERHLEQFGDHSHFGEDIARQTERAQHETLALQKSFNSIRGPVGTFDLLTRDAQRAQARSFQVQQELARIQAQIARGGSQTFLDGLAADAVKAEAAIKRLEKEELRLQIQQASRRPNAPATHGGAGSHGGGLADEIGEGFLSELGIPLSAGLAVAAGTALFVEGMHKSIEAARQAAEANHVLMSSATEAGLAYETAAEGAERFAQQTGQARTAAKASYAEIARIAGNIGEGQNLQRDQQALADLAAAHGTNANDILESVVTGREAGLRKAGIFDVQKRYKDEAAALRVNTDALSENEQMHIRWNAVIEHGQQVQGSAAEFLASTAGQLQVADANLNNLTTSLGESILASMEFRDLLASINGLLGAMSISSSEVARKLKQGMTPKEIAAEATGGTWTKLWDLGKGTLTTPLAGAGLGYDLLTGTAAEAKRNFDATVFGQNDRRRDELQLQIEKDKKFLDHQAEEAKKQKEALERQQKEEADKRANEMAANKQITTSLTQIGRDPHLQSQIDGLQSLRHEIQEFGDTGALSADKVTEKMRSLDQQIFETNKRIEEIVRSTFKDTRTFFDDITQRVNKDNPFVVLFQQADSAMERMQQRFGSFGPEFVQQMLLIENRAIEMEKISLRIQSAQKVLDIQGEIRKLQFGHVGTSAEDDRRLAIQSKQIDAAKNIPLLLAQAEALDRRLTGPQGLAIDRIVHANVGALYATGTLALQYQQFQDLERLKRTFSGETDYGDRAARSKINQEEIALFQSLGPAEQAAIARGYRGQSRDQITRAFREEAAERRRAIEDERAKAEVGRYGIEVAQKALSNLSRFGGFENDAARKEYLARSGALSENEMTAEIRRGRMDALAVEAKKEAAKEKLAAELMDQQTKALNRITSMITDKGFKLDESGTGVLVNLKINNETGNPVSGALGEGFGQ